MQDTLNSGRNNQHEIVGTKVNCEFVNQRNKEPLKCFNVTEINS